MVNQVAWDNPPKNFIKSSGNTWRKPGNLVANHKNLFMQVLSAVPLGKIGEHQEKLESQIILRALGPTRVKSRPFFLFFYV